MAELYIGKERDMFNKTSDNYLQVNSCGVQRTLGNGFHVIREEGRVDYHILYVKQGVCHVYYDGIYHELTAGDFVFYEPNHRHEYRYPEGQDTESFWVHFHGIGALSAAIEASLSFGIHKCTENKNAESNFLMLMKSFYEKNTTRANGFLLLLLSDFGEKKENAMPDKIANAAHFLQLNYFCKTDIDALASMCNLSRSRFQHLFKAHLGVSPLTYHLQAKIEKAKELLKLPDLTISQISEMVGIDDPFYFSRVFKKSTGVSPKGYKSGNGEFSE